MVSPSLNMTERLRLTFNINLDEFTRDACHICGMPRSEMSAYQHGEGVCNQRPIGCPLCSKTFTLWSHYETHKKCHQKLKQRQYPCQSCGKVIISDQFCWNIVAKRPSWELFRSSPRPATGTCTSGSTREFAPSSAPPVGFTSGRKLTYSKSRS